MLRSFGFSFKKEAIKLNNNNGISYKTILKNKTLEQFFGKLLGKEKKKVEEKKDE